MSDLALGREDRGRVRVRRSERTPSTREFLDESEFKPQYALLTESLTMRDNLARVQLPGFREGEPPGLA